MLLLRAVAKQCYMWQRATPNSVSSLFQSAQMAGGTGGTDDTTSSACRWCLAPWRIDAQGVTTKECVLGRIGGLGALEDVLKHGPFRRIAAVVQVRRGGERQV